MEFLNYQIIGGFRVLHLLLPATLALAVWCIISTFKIMEGREDGK